MTLSRRTQELANIFSTAITQHPNDVAETARFLYANIDSATVTEILDAMSDPNSELSKVLADAANVFHKHGSEKAPDLVTPEQIPGMVGRLSVYLKYHK